ncbi:oleandomycin transport system ATP-binding protein [Promicromonospora umidemergens]|uniref:Daunorubicin resistance protein DrrA family ABC transporter ATP-binding protein n=1 Tax=Promicromonospora umidemergens TaxID=629679 RepID=A0ABP8WKN9_9MICO|nr:ATP-binding cassette domain-containing protein [Promicromonospora umidemergens]MCP2283950.1 oleandomycin transport system ATP-binding protein [Promicromonospora umidemergens]
MSYAFEAEGLVKRYGRTTALAGIDLRARSGTVLGVLGPNGAGKTTAIQILATLLQPDAGRATVGGLDVVRDAALVRRRIGLTGQYATVDEDLTGAENLVLLGRLLDLSRAAARARATELLTQLGLTSAGGLRVSAYSGGMRRRLDLAAGLIGRPEIVFLDEPTTGLDPGKREDLWATIRSLADDGATVLLTTQYLEEADALADEITVIDHGRVIAHDTPAGLKQLVGGRTIVVRPADPDQLAAVARVVERVTGRPVEHQHGGALTTPVDAAQQFTDVVGALGSAGIDVAELALRLPSLDEVFFSLTGVTRRTGMTGVTETKESA